jgi:hypothetical protein
MLSMRIAGKSIEEIEAHFGVKRSLVYKGLSEARKGELLLVATDYITGRLIPKALLVVEAAMEHENWKDVALPAALAVLKGTVLTQRFQVQQVAPPAQEETFEAYRERIVLRRRAAADSAGAPAGSEPGAGEDGPPPPGPPRLSLPPGETVVEGEVVRDRAGDAPAPDGGGDRAPHLSADLSGPSGRGDSE